MRQLNKGTWPYQLELDCSGDLEGSMLIDKWCEEYIGKVHTEWYGYYRWNGIHIYGFTDPKNYIAFKIKWGK